MEKIIFGAGCFWGVEHTFRKVPGVIDAPVGYSAGTTENPTYREVCTGTTGHAEVVLVEFDNDKVGIGELLKVFFDKHDPTTLNSQGPDFGTQYRSGIYYYTKEQEEAAIAFRNKLDSSGVYSDKIVTEILPAKEFYRAEEYHQQYYVKNNLNPHC